MNRIETEKKIDELEVRVDELTEKLVMEVQSVEEGGSVNEFDAAEKFRRAWSRISTARIILNSARSDLESLKLEYAYKTARYGKDW